MLVGHSRTSYPTNPSPASSCKVIQSPLSCPAAERERVFCFSISASKPLISTEKPLSLAIRDVRSKGKPYVSYNSKATLPETTFSLISARSDLIFSNFFRPLSNVLKKEASSSCTTLAINASWDLTSGNTSPKVSDNTGINWYKKGRSKSKKE